MTAGLSGGEGRGAVVGTGLPSAVGRGACEDSGAAGGGAVGCRCAFGKACEATGLPLARPRTMPGLAGVESRNAECLAGR